MAAEGVGSKAQQTWSHIPALSFLAEGLGQVLWSHDGSSSSDFSVTRRGGVIVEGTWCVHRGLGCDAGAGV